VDEHPDEIDMLEARFADLSALPSTGVISAYITQDPGAARPARLPNLELRRDLEVYPQVYEHVRVQAAARPGVYEIRLRAGGKYVHQVRLNLLFAGGAVGGGLSGPAVAPAVASSGARELVVVPPVDTVRDRAREIGERMLDRALERIENPGEPPHAEEDDGDEDDDDELEDAEEDEDEDDEDEDEESAFAGIGGLISDFMKQDGAKAMVGDFFSSMSAERRGRAKKLEAEAELVSARAAVMRRQGTVTTAPAETTLAGDEEQHEEQAAPTNVAELLRFRVVDDAAG
jgi:hypothetical protein